jgi:2,2-dialkylglycine decarboxylase (pyruvate)
MFGFERGGVGISAVTTTAVIEETIIASGYAATHSHSNDPLICAAGIASLDVVEQEDVPARARDRQADARAARGASAALRVDRRCGRAGPADGHRAGSRPARQGAAIEQGKRIGRLCSSKA